MFINSYVVWCVISLSQFRKWEYYPLALMSSFDVVYTFLSHFTVNVKENFTIYFGGTNLENKEPFSNIDFLKQYQEFTNTAIYACFSRVLQTLFGSYAAGLCTLLLAIDWYVAVCWAADARRLITKTTRKVACLSVTGLKSCSQSTHHFAPF